MFANALGAFSPTKFVPLLVPSCSLIWPPAEASVPTMISSTALFESKSNAEFAVATLEHGLVNL